MASVPQMRYLSLQEPFKNLDQGMKGIAAFLDLAKAFDTVPHESLLDVLDVYGIKGVVSEVFASYLTGRIPMTKIGNVSVTRQNKMGIPQGTVIGPLLFILYGLSKTDSGK
ncbi:unnamed protein product [Acanthoscelides obtectus]|uniref:Reverse transcriptase domain-containing protein n=1 Tax=Acanthoscelides obtectus TaxID=200917 RepID=A0A9P0Q7G3_ACAOB|nr:unnamed protein product [Acanthoscelides obtectus]CAK1659541.1 hypothetical protein AOBTE_LOCUS21519 [Acanthoscelides obtectus]